MADTLTMNSGGDKPTANTLTMNSNSKTGTIITPGYEVEEKILCDETVNVVPDQQMGVTIGTIKNFDMDVTTPLSVIYDGIVYNDLPVTRYENSFTIGSYPPNPFFIANNPQAPSTMILETADQEETSHELKVISKTVTVSDDFTLALKTANPPLKHIKDGSADGSIEEGYSTTASGMDSHAEGTSTKALKDSSHAEGTSTEASGDYSHAEGKQTTASGSVSHAEGKQTTASGSASHAEGNSTKASGSYSHAEGTSTRALKDSSHAEGNGTTASGSVSHAEGNGTTASGSASHAEGNGTTASSSYSHAEGNQTTASGMYSHAEGGSTTASGMYSHAEGIFTASASDYQHVQGKYNVEDKNDVYAFIIGNGTSDTRSNAFAIKWDGTIVVWNNGTAVELTPAKLAALIAG